MIRVGIVGSTGYGGCELVRFLLTHKEVEIKWVSSRTYTDEEYSSVYSSYFKLLDQQCVDEDITKYLDDVDVVFFATPQGVCAKMLNEEVLSKVKVIDLSADYRIKDVKTYEQWYGIDHASPQFIDEAVYGLCEINRDKVKQARLIANPGCYPTCSILSVYPLAKADLIDMDTLIIDAKSGVSGAGRGAKVANQEVLLNFTPHLIPMNRGILITAYAKLKKGVNEVDVAKAYQCYDDEYFVRVLKSGVLPEVRSVKASNFVDINYKVDPRTNRVIMMGAMDNLVKGAAGQAIQNMNIMFGLDEKEGLMLAPAIL